jgi:hypothetical protein
MERIIIVPCVTKRNGEGWMACARIGRNVTAIGTGPTHEAARADLARGLQELLSEMPGLMKVRNGRA